jgi:hypothetical protein
MVLWVIDALASFMQAFPHFTRGLRHEMRLLSYEDDDQIYKSSFWIVDLHR